MQISIKMCPLNSIFISFCFLDNDNHSEYHTSDLNVNVSGTMIVIVSLCMFGILHTDFNLNVQVD